MKNELESRLKFCEQAIAKISDLVLEGFQNNSVKRERKQDGSWVTDIDRGVEEVLRAEIEKAFPGEKIIGEEFGETAGQGELCWFIDPIDGTQSFVSGVPLFGSMIGLTSGDKSVLGYVHMPALNESVYAARECGAFWKPMGVDEVVPCSVSTTEKMSESLLVTTSCDSFPDGNKNELYNHLMESCQTSRGWSDCYAHMLVATSRADIALDGGCRDWDTVPFQVILEEAGGRFCSLKGDETPFGQSMVSSNARVFSELQSVLKKYS